MIGHLNAKKDALLVKMSEFKLTRQSHLDENEKLKDNLTSLGKDNDNVKLKVMQLKRELDKVKFVKINIENRSKKLTQILTGYVRFSNDKSGLGFNKFAPSTSNAKKETTFVKTVTKKKFVKKKTC